MNQSESANEYKEVNCASMDKEKVADMKTCV